MVTITRHNFRLQEIEKEFQENFKCEEKALSDFHCNALCWIGEAIAETKETVFCDNNLWWDDKKQHRWSVFMTPNGNAMLKDWTAERMWRIAFK